MLESNNLPFTVLFVVLFLIVVMIIITVFIVKSRNKIFAKEIEKRNLELEFQKQIHIKTLEVQENERKRIAQDLHDDISSKLIALSLNLHLLQSEKATDLDKRNTLSKIEAINTSTIESSRKIAHNLFPPILEKFGLNDAIEELVSDYNKSKQIEIHYKYALDFSIIDKDKQLHIFRIIQELINNSIKHGKASIIDIVFKNENSNIHCEYSDNGIGLNSNTFAANKGLGFINIESRIKSINGNYVIDFSKPGFVLKFDF